MFNFIKKATGGVEEEERERRKREKRERKEKLKRDRGAVSAEELLRIDEVRRSLKLTKARRKEKEKLPSGITADYSASFFAELDRDANYSNYPLVSDVPNEENNHIIIGETRQTSVIWRESLLQSDSSEASLNSLNNPNGVPNSQAPNLPPLPPRPPKRGILKGPRLSSINSQQNGQNEGKDPSELVHNGQDPSVLMQNTLRNELITYQNVPVRNGHSNDEINNVQNFTKKVIHSPIESNQKNYYNNHGSPPPITVSCHEFNGNGNNVTSPSPSVDTLTDSTSNSSFATPPFSMSPTGDADAFHQFPSYLDGMNLPLPEVIPAELPAPRVLTIQRQKGPRSDFGFSLRRAMIVERNLTDGSVNGVNSSDDEKDGVRMKAVIFAEPGTLGHGHETGLLPGDRLLEVNGVSVDDKSRDEIIEMIKGSHDQVTVKVQPVAELSEVWKRWAGMNGSGEDGLPQDAQHHQPVRKVSKSDDEDDAKWNSGGERVWLCHRQGFTAVRRVGNVNGAESDSSGQGEERRPGLRTTVKLVHSGQDIDVEDDDLEKANPPQFNLVEDLASLRYLNESSALNVLRQRYGSNLVHTAAGHSLVLINPPAPLTIYSEKVVSMFKGCRWEDAPPHLYSTARAAHRAMLSSRRDQSIVFLGRCGSGKSASLRRCAQYLAAQSPNNTWTNRIRGALSVISAAGCSGGGRSGVAQMLNLHYDQTGALAGAMLQSYLLDITRIPTKQRLDGTFDIFSFVVHGCDGGVRRTLLLEGARAGGEEAAGLARITEALNDLQVTERERMALWKIVAAIWHLAGAGAIKVSGRYQFAEPAAGARVAQLLGCCPEELSRALFSGAINAVGQARTPSPTDRTEKEISGQEALEGLAIGLYLEFFNCMVALVNRCLTTNARTVSSLLLVDPPGLAGGSGGIAAAGLQQLATNYLLERLQLLAHERAVLAPRALCRQEGVPLDPSGDEEDWITEVMNPGPMVELLDKPPQATMLRTSQADLRDVDRKGMLWLLDEESMHPGASDSSFVERVAAMWGTAPQQLMKKAPHPMHFILHHMQGTYPVMYNASGWLKASRENPISRNAVGLLQESTNDDISRLFVWSRGLCGSGPDAQASLRRASSIRRTLTTGAVVVNRRSIVAQIQAGVESVLGALRRTRPRFVFCALPRRSIPSQQLSHDAPLDIPLLRSQFRGFQILEAARMYKQGFPDSLPFAEFARRFRLLTPHHQQQTDISLPSLTSMSPEEQRRIIEEMITTIDLDPSLYRIGLSQVLLRAGALASLEARRDSLLRERIVSLQAVCRGVLARRAAAKKRVQHVAARCIQRNVRAFLDVRDWPWWRLLVRVSPLLAVNRTEDQLRIKTEELETLKAKSEKLEQERSALKHENDKLENKLSEMTAELAVEQSASSLAAERLSAETSERLRLERDIHTLKQSNTALHQTAERLETELMFSRAETASGGSGEAGSDDEGSVESGSGSKYKRRLQAALRELDATRRQLRQQHEDDLEQLVTIKKQLEKKLADAYEEANEQRQVAAQWKRKAQKAASDANDLRLLLDEQGAKLALLEKRQRRADGETQTLQEETRRERQLRERAQREVEQLQQEKHQVEQQLADIRLELELKEERFNSAQRELQEMAYGGNGGEEVGILRRAKHELEAKCKDQEEELDEMAGQLQLLESHKVRLEMSLEQQRKAARLETAQRDEELEEVRAQAAKKVEALESQLEAEHSERTLLTRERHELERRLVSLEESARAEAQERDAREQRVKKDLRRARALAKDAQAVLERREKEAPNKQQLRQLRDKLDDMEVSLRTAVKARQAAEAEASESTTALEECVRGKREAEARAAQAQRDATTAQAQLEEAEEEAAEVMKKYRACVQTLGEEQRAARDASARAASLEDELRQSKEKVAELQARLASMDNVNSAGQAAQHDKLELRTKELEARLELEQTARQKLEAQVSRAREAASTSAQTAGAAQAREALQMEEIKKMQRQIRELREELCNATAKMEEAMRARSEAENRLDTERAEGAGTRSELREAKARIALLQQAIADELSPDNNSDSDNDSYSSDESIDTFLANHKITGLNITGNHSPKSSDGRQSRSSVSSSKQLSPAKESFA